MKIAVFIKSTTYHKGHGGLETLNKNLCEGLAQKGHIVTVFAPKKDVEKSEITENNVNYIFIESVYRTLFRSLNKNNWFNKSLEVFKEKHSQTPFDLVVSQSTAGLSIIENKHSFGVKIVGISHGSIISEIRTRFANSLGLKDLFQLTKDTAFSMLVFFGRQRDYVFGCDRIVAVSNYVKKTLIDETYCPEEKIKVIHNGSDFYAKLSSLKDFERVTGHFLHVGRITKEKGIDLFPKMFSDKNFEKYFLDIIGTGEYESELKKEILNSGLENIIVYGKIPYEETINWFTKSNVFLFPTRRLEGFPMVLIEAMFAGLPIVAFDMGGVSDAVIDGKTGFLVKPGDFGTFKDRAYQLISDDALRLAMSEASSQKAQKEFTLDVMIDKYENLFKEIIK